MTLKNFLLVSTFIYFLGQSVSAANEKASVSRSGLKRIPKLFSMEPDDGKVEINLDLSVPFMSIPLEDRKGPGEPLSLFNINPNGLTIFGTLLVMSAIIIPLFVKKIPVEPVEPAPLYNHYHGKEHKRRDRALDFWNFDESINEILSRDGPIAPCAQKIVCSAIAAASHSNNPTSADKIIDGLFSHKWFKQISNGTVIEEAVAVGRKVAEIEECNATYNECVLSQQIVANLLKIIGI